MSSAGNRRVGRSGHGERRPRSEDSLPGLEEIESRHEGEDGSLNVGPVLLDKKTEDLTISPEEALKEAKETIAQRDARLAEAEAARTKAEQERDQTRSQLTTETSKAVQSQEALIQTAISAATQRRDAAKLAMRTAREAGDMDAELAAVDAIGAANADLATANRNKESFEAWKRTQANRPVEPSPQQTHDGPSTEAQEWLGSHPLYFSQTEDGREYQAQAMAAHSAALAQRIPEGSKAYVEFIDGRLEKIYGKDHGQIGQRREQSRVTDTPTRQPRQARSATSTGAPTTREGGYEYRGGGDFEYTDRSSGARLRLVETTDRDGRPIETVQGTIPAAWREYAKVNRMGDVEYAISQLKIQRDMADGGSLAGLTYQQNGVYS